MKSGIRDGAWLAVLSALAFGLTAPFIERAGREVGSFSTAALLYIGASACAMLLAPFSSARGPRLARRHAPTIVVMGVLGAATAPVLLAIGLQRAGAMTGSLLLNLEAVFTVILARLFYRELIGRQVGVALVSMATGGVLLAWGAGRSAHFDLLGVLAVMGATLAWGADNTLSLKLAALDPLDVVAAKGIVGALLTLALSRVFGEPIPAARAVLALLACGATGYGLSLRLYLLAQRRVGAARTGSIFAFAPFVGAAAAFALGDRSAGPLTLVAAAFFGIGVYLHITERHAHLHHHPASRHPHANQHEHGHHDHVHDPPFEGDHSHEHEHTKGLG